ncbi:ferredoxin [Mycobacterium sp. CVI_P3]|uniref:Ferredoxin n=1 Tax=Mycobacterium pinniadriaticum TaxID=2994102 RepID=A0ABT3SAP9_9MYCO|nr:ferredoxin [Mycobacterium pinniadriaticum]MCX2929571.1 ferredoxin [Mycobacterium pinniadriaticum]MCX2935995.1 ferredoxin [Mycobacterium pinniadriaticum]
MKASIDDGRCRGHGVCTTICPEVFAMTDDGYAEAILDEVPAELQDSAREAAEACPESAVILD